MHNSSPNKSKHSPAVGSSASTDHQKLWNEISRLMAEKQLSALKQELTELKKENTALKQQLQTITPPTTPNNVTKSPNLDTVKKALFTDDGPSATQPNSSKDIGWSLGPGMMFICLILSLTGFIFVIVHDPTRHVTHKPFQTGENPLISNDLISNNHHTLDTASLVDVSVLKDDSKSTSDVPFDGEALEITIDGNVFSGKLVLGMKQGHGVMKYKNGNLYVGQWLKDVRHGQGAMNFTNGNFYEGLWANGKINGRGRFFYANGDTYDGEWLDGKYHGVGTYKYQSGDYYEGGWQCNHKHGFGIFSYQDGEILSGIWENDTLQNNFLHKFLCDDIQNNPMCEDEYENKSSECSEYSM